MKKILVKDNKTYILFQDLSEIDFCTSAFFMYNVLSLQSISEFLNFAVQNVHTLIFHCFQHKCNMPFYHCEDNMDNHVKLSLATSRLLPEQIKEDTTNLALLN
jgi:hypothetical protein